MKYEWKKKYLGRGKAKCIFCEKQVGFGDYFDLCREHGDKYYT